MKVEKMAKHYRSGESLLLLKLFKEKYEQGFKNICLRTNNIEAVKNKLQSERVEVVGPDSNGRDTHKDGKVKWQLLLYNESGDDEIKPPFLFNGKKVIPCVLKNCKIFSKIIFN